MSSVRVRRGTYSSLRDDVPNGPTQSSRSRRNTLTDIFFPKDATASVESGAAELTNNSNLPRTTSDSGTLTPEQPPLRSKVSNHILNGRGSVRTGHWRRERSPTSVGLSFGNRLEALQGSQEDVLVSGRDGATVSVHSTRSSFGSSDSEHHEDDIVEHLDAIDPQIGAVSTLTNTANSILIPPLPLFPRKPVVSLPERGIEDVEKSPHNVQKDDLDHHVEDVITKHQLFKRTMKGVWAFVKTPAGFIAAVYGFCVVFWGAAIVIFLAKIINFHNANTQGFWVEVSSQVENGLFTVTGVGLIPFRAMDTHRVSKIWCYKRKTRKLRKQRGLPELIDEDDLPDPIYDVNYVHVLTDAEQADLHYQQTKFMKSQTWYRPHGTDTHRAFPINLALLICCLVDGNSIFQCILCGTMWGLNRFQRPAWSTGILIPASFLCGILSAVFIWHGCQKTRRTEAVQDRLRAALTTDDEFINPSGTGPENIPELNGTTTDSRSRRPLRRQQRAAAASTTETIPLVSHGTLNDSACL
ncbi:hypothetical protein NEOLEDRAFT_1140860 [Neolentinus lepideus HHB14362 ss-1]|uniref:Uncharacterized protein n=1 Tax=Neolentinus lepideus HHB14362 ss-1 TaxID=1314782 RepID=A0A165P1P7_9AGAM|nr:hypothetical protein NEOLEDRAFT_1140860 [Neolentinus lepideus HHB14362 ss-1]